MPFIPLDFPREVLELSAHGGHGGRYLVKNWNELESYWQSKNGRGTAIVRHFVMDFDCKDFKQKGIGVDFAFMHGQVKRLHQHLLTNDYHHYVYFSGGGFHIWIPFADTYLPTDGLEVTRIKSAGKMLMMNWHDAMDLRNYDS